MIRQPAFAVLLALIVLVGVGLRLYRLQDVPAGFSQDEASEGYDAWSLWQTGYTRNGAFLPFFANTFEDYNEALYRYLLVPLMAAFGLREWAVRLPAALAGTASIVLVGLVGRALFSPAAGLFAAAWYAVMPWHLVLSRLGMRIILLVPFLLLGIWLVWRWAESTRKRAWHLPAIAAWWGLAWYSYTPVRVILPLLLVLLAAVHGRALLSRRRSALVAAGVFVLFSLPLVWMYATHYDQIMARARLTAVSSTDLPREEQRATIVRQYAQHFAPGFLFRHGDYNPIMSPRGVGQLYWTALPFIALGLLRLLRRRDGATVLLLGWLLIGPLPSALTAWAPHAHRALACEPVWSLLAGLGTAGVADWIGRPGRGARWLAGALLALAAAGAGYETVRFCRIYFGPYRYEVGPIFFEGLDEAIRELRRREPSYETVLLSDAINRPEIFYLFYTGFDPARYLALRREQNLGPDYDYWMLHFDHVWCANPQRTVLYDALYLLPDVPAAWERAVVWRSADWALVDGNAARGAVRVAREGESATLVNWSALAREDEVRLETRWYGLAPETAADWQAALTVPETGERRLFFPAQVLRTEPHANTGRPVVSLASVVPRPATGADWPLEGWLPGAAPLALGNVADASGLHPVWGEELPRYGLVHGAVATETVSAGLRVSVALEWRVLASAPRPHRTIVHFSHPERLVVADHDPQRLEPRGFPMPPGERLAGRAEALLDGPPGTYQVLIGWYDPDTGERVPLLGDTETLAEIGRVTVAPAR